MPKDTKIDFLEAKQGRSKQTLNDLIDSANDLVNTKDLKQFNARSLSTKSGYALGTLNKRLGSIDNIFLWAIEKGRDKKIKLVINFLDQFDPLMPIEVFAEKLIDLTFDQIGKVGPSVMRYYVNKCAKRDGFSINENSYAEELLEPYIKMINANQTNTFKKVSKNEMRLLLRCSQSLVEKPFIFNDEIAGTDEHRRISKEMIVRIYGK